MFSCTLHILKVNMSVIIHFVDKFNPISKDTPHLCIIKDVNAYKTCSGISKM